LSEPDTLGSFMARHRTRLGLSPNQLAHRTSSKSSTDVRDIEAGLITQLRPRPALQLARALELDDLETDRFLYLCGSAPLLDWQRLAEEIMGTVGLLELLHARAASQYALRRDPSTPTPRRPRHGE